MMCLEKISYKTFVQTLLMILFQKNYQYGDKVNNRQQTFSMYMQKWLYDANSGYYRQNHVGIAGDFYTAINVSKFFGGAISRYILKMLESQHLSLPIYIVEIGGNNGNLISDIAEFMSAFNSEVFASSIFCTLEPIHCLATLQQQTFSHRITQRFQKELYVFESFRSLNAFTEHNIFFITNELFDSMPCDVVLQDSMLYYDNQGNFIWDRISPEVTDFQMKYHAKGVEISLEWERFIADICHNITQKWIFVTFDYGDFIARDMNLRIYHKHKVYNFYEELNKQSVPCFFGTSDITYDIDFSVLRAIFKHFGIKENFCLTQAKALIEECLILEVFEMFSPHFSSIALIKQKANLHGLIAPNAMGERFKALCVTNL